jgi:hypothetical protein
MVLLRIQGFLELIKELSDTNWNVSGGSSWTESLECFGKFSPHYTQTVVQLKKSPVPVWNRTKTVRLSSVWPSHNDDWVTAASVAPASFRTDRKSGSPYEKTSWHGLLCTQGSISIDLNRHTKMAHNTSQQYYSIHSTAIPSCLQNNDTSGNKISRHFQPQVVSK